MSLTVLKLGHTVFDIDIFLKAYRQLYKQAPKLDYIKADTPLGAFKLIDNLSDSSLGLQHISYSFLIVSVYSIETLLNYSTELHIASRYENNIYLSILSGNLLEWKTTIEDYLNESFSPLIRAVLGKCLQEFEKDGLGILWQNYSKQTLDGTLILRER